MLMARSSIQWPRWYEASKGWPASVIDFEVPVWTIDAVGLDDLTAIKIDAEGYETEVLHGATRTLERCRLIASCECVENYWEGMTWYIPGFMRALGYDGWFHYQEQFWPVSSLNRRLMQAAAPHGQPRPDLYIVTFLFIPRQLNDLRQRLSRFRSFCPA